VGFSRTWWRSLYGALGTAVVVPVGLVLSIALAATVGGAGDGVGGLRQLLGGPTLPASDPVARALSPTRQGAQGGVPAVPRALPVAVAAAPARTPASSRRRTSGGSRPTTRRRTSSSPSRTVGPTPAATTPTAAAPTPTTPAPSNPTPTPTPTPSPPDPVGDVVRGVGQVADDVVRPLPVVGPPVADAVGTVIELVAPPKVPQPQGSATALVGE
jgi:hypothetical protein